MVIVNYEKRKNTELFKTLEDVNYMGLSNAQNYIPIYKRFFELNDTNYNSINLNNKWYIHGVNSPNEEDYHLYNCRLKNIKNNKSKDKDLFVKMAPLLDPYKYLVGKYNIKDDKLFTLPKLNSNQLDCNPKYIDPNNSGYVDGLFLYFTSALLHTHEFLHGVDFYGSFLGIKNDFVINIFDDIDYLNNSEFFNNNKNILFTVDDYEHLYKNTSEKLKPITIQHNTSEKSLFSIASFDNEIFDNLFEENKFNDVDNNMIDLVDITNVNILDNKDCNNNITLHSKSSCSSRSSYTNDEDSETSTVLSQEISNNEVIDGSDENDNGENDNEDNSENEDDSCEEEIIEAIIPKFPVQVICMEYCEDTFDNLIVTEELTPEEWYSAFMQIIMILITYQKTFNFTHNDLHTNNVMYNTTDKKFLYYCYKNKYYKVPTFGRIFKIIDFGRSIYKFDGKIFCSDSFQSGGDAATQYNTEPYLNEKKPRLEPNYSFDLCRLACSIFDYAIDDFEYMKDIRKCEDPIKRLILEWCLDDKGINILYKNDGSERYPDFKLYKMISRFVHNHTPHSQLERPEFDAFSKFKGDVPNDCMNIDKIPSYV